MRAARADEPPIKEERNERQVLDRVSGVLRTNRGRFGRPRRHRLWSR